MNDQNKTQDALAVLRACTYAYFSSNETLQKIHRAISTTYIDRGETLQSIDEIQHQLGLYIRQHYGFKTLQDYSHKLIQETQTKPKHSIDRIVDTENIKVSLHCIPAHYEIPDHCHPGRLSIIYALGGNLQISQASLESSTSRKITKQSFPQKICKELKPAEACAGLKNLRNIHKIKTFDSPSAYLSIRLKTQNLNQINTLDKCCQNKKFFSGTTLHHYCIVGAFVTGAFTSVPTFASDLLKSESKNPEIVNILSLSILENVTLANQLRLGIGKKKDKLKAIELYSAASQKGNAEAQYHLGIMYLEGTGVTDDPDLAYQLISSSAAQGYPLALEVKEYLLAEDEVLDC